MFQTLPNLDEGRSVRGLTERLPRKNAPRDQKRNHHIPEPWKPRNGQGTGEENPQGCWN